MSKDKGSILPTLRADLKRLAAKLEAEASKYKDRKHEKDIVEGIYKGKNKAYLYSSKKIRDLLSWHRKGDK